MAQTATRKRARTSASLDSDQPNTRKKPGPTKRTSGSAKDRGTRRQPGADSSLQAAIKAAKQGRNGAGDALEQIRAKAEDVFVAIEEERRKFNDARSGAADGRLAHSLTTEYALHAHDPITGCEAFESCRRALQRLQSLAAGYDDTAVGHDQATTTATGPAAAPRGTRWPQDVVDLTALNGKAKKLARQIVEGHLAPTGWPVLAAGPQATSGGGGSEEQELAQIAMEILDEALPKGSATWGTAAAQLVDVYGSMLKDTFK